MALKRPVDEGDDLRRYSYRERSSRVHPSRQKISVISGTCPPLADQCLKILVNPVIPSKISSTNDQRLSTNDSLSAICAGTLNQNLKKIKIFSPFLTPYLTTTYLFSAFSAFSAVNLFFVPRACRFNWNEFCVDYLSAEWYNLGVIFITLIARR